MSRNQILEKQKNDCYVYDTYFVRLSANWNAYKS